MPKKKKSMMNKVSKFQNKIGANPETALPPPGGWGHFSLLILFLPRGASISLAVEAAIWPCSALGILRH